MHNRHQHKGKNGQYKGHHHAQMLDRHRRAQANKRSERYRPKPMFRVSANGTTWIGLLMLLIVVPAVVAETRVLDFVAPEIKFHNLPVARLSANAACKVKGQGINAGKVCDVAGTTFFLKKFPIHAVKPTDSAKAAAPIPAAKSTKRKVIVQEEFNRHLLKKVGVKVPQTHFFKQLENTGKHHFYIGTEKIDGIKFGDRLTVSDKELGVNGVAKLAVAGTLIADLHEENYGWNEDGLIVIDADGADMIFHTIDKFVDVAEYAMKYTIPPLSLQHLEQMVKIYEKLLRAGLPEFHEELFLTKEKYFELLNIYMETCQQTIKMIQQSHTDVSRRKSEIWANLAWNHVLRSAHPQVIASDARQHSSL